MRRCGAQCRCCGLAPGARTLIQSGDSGRVKYGYGVTHGLRCCGHAQGFDSINNLLDDRINDFGVLDAGAKQDRYFELVKSLRDAKPGDVR